MSEPQLSEEEARKFLELYEKVSEDMNQAMKESIDWDGEASVFIERYDGSSGSLYTDCVRNKYKRFVEKIYLSQK